MTLFSRLFTTISPPDACLTRPRTRYTMPRNLPVLFWVIYTPAFSALRQLYIFADWARCDYITLRSPPERCCSRYRR